MADAFFQYCYLITDYQLPITAYLSISTNIVSLPFLPAAGTATFFMRRAKKTIAMQMRRAVK